jgi:cytochrome c biogenesis protein CcmG/thiol:disulfide interchange protein DsbE
MNWSGAGWRRALAAAVVAASIIGLLAYGMTQDPRAIPSPLPGQKAPEFSLAVFSYPTDAPQPKRGEQLLDTIRFDSLRGKVVVLNFWASWCLACRDEHVALSAAAMALRGTDARFFGVLYQDVPQNGRDWIVQMGGQSYQGLYDPKSRTAIDYGIYGVPETFFIARDGRVAYKHVGAVTTDVLMDTVRALLAEKVKP